jgi:AcrR family transcriptional regulator
VTTIICSVLVSDGWERRIQRTRADVLAAVGELITEAGVDGMTMRRLAERAGVAVATLYNQFGDRDGVLVAYVANGLDELEHRLDAGPAVGPIETTRAMLGALDDTLVADEPIWRPLFAALKSGTGVHGMGEVGDRVVALIEQDLAKAAAAGMFDVDVDTERLARHVFVTRMARVERWAQGVIDWSQYRTSSALGLELILAAVLGEPHRSDALGRSGVVR